MSSECSLRIQLGELSSESSVRMGSAQIQMSAMSSEIECD